MLQNLVVALLVTGCTGYAGWTLMPSAWRRSLAIGLLKLPLPQALATRMRHAAKAANSCGCDGCDHAPTKNVAARGGEAPARPAATTAQPITAQPITFHPRVRH